MNIEGIEYLTELIKDELVISILSGQDYCIDINVFKIGKKEFKYVSITKNSDFAIIISYLKGEIYFQDIVGEIAERMIADGYNSEMIGNSELEGQFALESEEELIKVLKRYIV